MRYCFLFFLLLMTYSCDLLSPSTGVYRRTLPTNSTSSTSSEKAEFRDLLEKDKINKKQVNAEVLTYLLNDTDPRDKATAAVIENNSNCDIILRVVGISNSQIYNLPISARSKNQFVLQKGSYTLRSTICGARYYSQKVLNDPLILKLSAQ